MRVSNNKNYHQTNVIAVRANDREHQVKEVSKKEIPRGKGSIKSSGVPACSRRKACAEHMTQFHRYEMEINFIIIY